MPDAVSAINTESINRLDGHGRCGIDGPNQHLPTLRNKKKEPLGFLGLHIKKKEPLGFLGFHIFMINTAFQGRESIDVRSSLQVYSTVILPNQRTRGDSHMPNPASATDKWLPGSRRRNLYEIRWFRLTFT